MVSYIVLGSSGLSAEMITNIGVSDPCTCTSYMGGEKFQQCLNKQVHATDTIAILYRNVNKIRSIKYM